MKGAFTERIAGTYRTLRKQGDKKAMTEYVLSVGAWDTVYQGWNVFLSGQCTGYYPCLRDYRPYMD